MGSFVSSCKGGKVAPGPPASHCKDSLEGGGGTSQQQPQELRQAWPVQEQDAAATLATPQAYQDLLDAIRARGTSSATSPALGVPFITNSDKYKTLLRSLPDCILDLNEGMPPIIQDAPMRLLLLDTVLTWSSLKGYEEIDTRTECVDHPYKDIREEDWEEVLVLSWRWGTSKPQQRQEAKGFSPMGPTQFQELLGLLHVARAQGFSYLWVDWSCVPQYSSDPADTMLELLRSKVFYARARSMIILPTFQAIQAHPSGGIVRPLLAKTRQVLGKRAEAPGATNSAIAAAVVEALLVKDRVAGHDYFSRVWTLAERMARYGRSERLCDWLSLEAWLGMVVDAMLKDNEDSAGSQIIYKRILGPPGTCQLEAILAPLAEAVRLRTMLVSEGLADMVADLIELALDVWMSASTLEEAPTPFWLRTYLGSEARSGIYNACNEDDRVWAVYSYFTWLPVMQRSKETLQAALEVLVEVAVKAGGNAEEYQRQGMFVQLGLTSTAPALSPTLAPQLSPTVEPSPVSLWLVKHTFEVMVSIICDKWRVAELRELCSLAAEDYEELMLSEGLSPLKVRSLQKSVQQLADELRAANQCTAGTAVAAAAAVSSSSQLSETLVDTLSKVHLQRLWLHLQSIGVTSAGDMLRRQALDLVPQAEALTRFEKLRMQGLLSSLSKARQAELVAAAQGGNANLCRKLVREGADAAAVDMEGKTALMHAALHGQDGVCKALLEEASAGGGQQPAGPLELLRVVNGTGETAIMLAARGGSAKTIGLLLVHCGAAAVTLLAVKDTHGKTALQYAANADVRQVITATEEKGMVAGKELAALMMGMGPLPTVDEVSKLLKGGANVNYQDPRSGDSPLDLAVRQGAADICKVLLVAGADHRKATDGGRTALHVAAEFSRADVLVELLTAADGADKEAKDGDGRTPMWKAAEMGSEDVIKKLLASGAVVDARSHRGSTPLHATAYFNKAGAAKLLLDAGANKDATNLDKGTPLHYASQNGHVKIVEVLLRAGADKEAKIDGGGTALHLASGVGHVEVVAVLLQAGADTEATTNSGTTPLDLAKHAAKAEVVALLEGWRSK